ncbi:MAG: hypothetical protein WBZ36_14425, partial [Candidatus Nitrosopolaris sp.]
QADYGNGSFSLFSNSILLYFIFWYLDDVDIQAPRYPEQLYMGAGLVLLMTRKDMMKKGFVARTFHIPEGLDQKLRMEAIKNKVRFSEVTISTLEEYLK